MEKEHTKSYKETKSPKSKNGSELRSDERKYLRHIQIWILHKNATESKIKGFMTHIRERNDCTRVCVCMYNRPKR